MRHPFRRRCQDGVERPERFIGNAYRVKIVVTQHNHTAELAFLDRAQLGLFLEKPAVLESVESDCLVAGNLLTGVDQGFRRRSCP